MFWRGPGACPIQAPHIWVAALEAEKWLAASETADSAHEHARPVLAAD